MSYPFNPYNNIFDTDYDEDPIVDCYTCGRTIYEDEAVPFHEFHYCEDCAKERISYLCADTELAYLEVAA